MKDWELDIIESIVNKVTRLEIREKTRSIYYVKARIVYYKLSQEMTQIPIVRISKHIGFHHATFLHNIKNFEYDILRDEKYNYIYQKCKIDASRIISDYDISKEELYENKTLLNENKNLKKENQELKVKLATAIKEISDDKTEEKLLNIFREMDFSVKLDLIQKAETILKVKKKLNETANVRRV